MRLPAVAREMLVQGMNSASRRSVRTSNPSPVTATYRPRRFSRRAVRTLSTTDTTQATISRTPAIFHSIGDAQAVPGLSAELHAFLGEHCFTGPRAVRSQSYVGPSIGQELMSKARLAIVLSLVMMLLYIWLRFQLRWGVAAVIALTHDTLITLGLFALFGKELSLPVVAAFLTLVGYSVNDTVVVFDRIRENLRNRSGSGLVETINLSLNQTLGRTVVTSGLTWIVVFGLYLYGGPALNPFAFVLTVGIIVGTYSSIFVASPVLVLWDRWQGEKKGAEHSGASPVRRVKKVRTS